MKPKKPIVLVSCGKTKKDIASAAKNLYTSDRFKAAKFFAEKTGDHWYILSAKHHLLHPDEVIEPYDSYIGDFSNSRLDQWGNKVVVELLKVHGDLNQCIVLADELYSSALALPLFKSNITALYPIRDLDEQQQVAFLDRVNKGKKQLRDQDRFYKLMQRIMAMPQQMASFSDIVLGDIPKRGVYFFFDPDETRRLAETPELRVVRVGTHGVSLGSKSTLWQRLKTHRGTDNGLGSHRSSIFRLHVGNAILRSRNEYFESWGIGMNAPKEIRDNEQQLENEVSNYLAKLRVAYLPILDEANADSDRSYIEKNVIGLLTYQGAIDIQSRNWLGTFSASAAVRSSGLWNIAYVHEEYDSAFLDIFEELIRRYEKNSISESSIAPKNWRQIMQGGHIKQQDLF